VAGRVRRGRRPRRRGRADQRAARRAGAALRGGRMSRLPRLAPLAAALVLAAWPLAAMTAETATPTTVDGGRVVPPEPSAPEPEVDPQRFASPPDDAFGAYQRGLYITALNLALPRADGGDAAAQTLVAEIYSRGLGVR